MVVAILAVLLLVAVIVCYQSTAVSTRQKWRGDGRFGQLAPEPPWPKRPVGPDARFALVSRRQVVVPVVAGAALVVAGGLLVAAGFEPPGFFAVLIGLLELGAGAGAAVRNRRALSFAAERLRDS